MLMAGFIVFGAIAVQRLPVGQYPDVDFPIVSISATLEGAAPEIMETDVADIIEEAVMAVEGIREITTNCRQGSANVTVEFDLDRDIDLALQDIQARVAQAAGKLPRDMDPVQIKKTNPEENPFMWVALSGTRSQKEISEYAKNSLRDRFLTVEGNGDVMMGGYLERNVRIWIDSEALKSRGLSVDDLLRPPLASTSKCPPVAWKAARANPTCRWKAKR
jgi:multidrug efflux pump subunit AcrB